ncbi:MAG: hypothetical protein ABJ226_06875 [Roseobacter sp.]
MLCVVLDIGLVTVAGYVAAKRFHICEISDKRGIVVVRAAAHIGAKREGLDLGTGIAQIRYGIAPGGS